MADLFFTGWRKWGALMSILIALAVPLFLAVKAQHEAGAYPTAKIKIVGYDPRDLLYGHYLMFRYNWDWADGQPGENACYGADCCLCLGEGADPKASIMTCETAAAQQCPRTVRGHYYGGTDFTLDNNRYLVSETRARELELILRDEPDRMRMEITLPPRGKNRIKMMYVDGLPVEDYLRQTPPMTQEALDNKLMQPVPEELAPEPAGD